MLWYVVRCTIYEGKSAACNNFLFSFINSWQEAKSDFFFIIAKKLTVQKWRHIEGGEGKWVHRTASCHIPTPITVCRLKVYTALLCVWIGGQEKKREVSPPAWNTAGILFAPPTITMYYWYSLRVVLPSVLWYCDTTRTVVLSYRAPTLRLSQRVQQRPEFKIQVDKQRDCLSVTWRKQRLRQKETQPNKQKHDRKFHCHDILSSQAQQQHLFFHRCNSRRRVSFRLSEVA